MANTIRNIAIIAHVDHGKTTLVDKLLTQSGTLESRNEIEDRVMDSNDIEKERGITILAKNTAITWNDYRINIIDTPGHADFGGEVERVMSMADCVLLVVDAFDGPMPQTRFVTQKAFNHGLKPILVVNKIDRDGARPDWVVDQVFDLFDQLGATDEQLDFPIVYASALNGIAGHEPDELQDDMTPLFETIIKHVEPPQLDETRPLQLQISSLDYSTYVGVIGVGRVHRGKIRPGQQVFVIDNEGNQRKAKVLQVMGYLGLDKIQLDEADAGEIVCITGIEGLNISDTICDLEQPEALPPLTVDEPTISMTFQVNTSPFAGQDGKLLTSRNIKDRLDEELIHNVALRVEQGDSADKFIVSGRGELHLSVLIENMRREGFELGISKPEVIVKTNEAGEKEEPYELVTIDVDEQHQGAIMEAMGQRRAEIKNLQSDGKGRIRLEAVCPSSGLIGFRSEFLTMTAGSGILTHIFSHYGPYQPDNVVTRKNGVLVSMVKGKTLAYSLFNLQERGRLMIEPNVDVYEGQIIGIHSRNNDLVVNPTKGKQLTNVRASGTDDALLLTPPILMRLEQALEFIEDDELVEVTPESIRVRKKLLTENERKRAKNK
ncbi:MAG: translational GTPase TypA [Pseudomonadota bacterium]|nr:translational GTPase TypA [Pseudomonadota bacterium]